MAIASMTGFARAEGRDDRYAWIWEARSVNARGLDIRCRLPPGMDALEPDVRRAVAARFGRGSIALGLQLRPVDGRPAVRVNRALLEQVTALARELSAGRDVAPARIDGLLALPGMLEPAEDEPGAEENRRAAILGSLEAALAALATARAEEGARLLPAVIELIDEIARSTEASAASAAAQPDALRARLRRQVEDLLRASPGLPEERLASEAALLAARADVREEIDRLASHVAAARALLAEGGAVGRRLDFLCQEFNREANTLCAKAAEIELTRLGLALKTAIERLREQVQNIE